MGITKEPVSFLEGADCGLQVADYRLHFSSLTDMWWIPDSKHPCPRAGAPPSPSTPPASIRHSPIHTPIHHAFFFTPTDCCFNSNDSIAFHSSSFFWILRYPRDKDN